MRRFLVSTGLAVLTLGSTGCHCCQRCVDSVQKFETWKWNALLGPPAPQQQVVCDPVVYAPAAVAVPAPICPPINTGNPCCSGNTNAAAVGTNTCCEGPAMSSGTVINGMTGSFAPTTTGCNNCGQAHAPGTVITTQPTLAPSTTVAPQTYSTGPIPGPVGQ